MQINGSSILVTGASGGLGTAMCQELARRGARLVITARREALLADLAAETGAEVLVADLTDRDDLLRVAERAGACDVLVANAGVGNDPSLAGLAATPGTRMYNATKFGLRGFALSFRQDLEGTGVGCSLVAPGFIRDAGMFAEGDLVLPPGVRTNTPADVAAGVVRAITANPMEVYVSPPEMRAVSTLATMAPAFSAFVQRKLNVSERTDR